MISTLLISERLLTASAIVEVHQTFRSLASFLLALSSAEEWKELAVGPVEVAATYHEEMLRKPRLHR